MILKGIAKGFLIGISFDSVKRVINGYPEPIRKIIIFCIRLTVFLSIFLFIYSFLSTRINSITTHSHAPSIFANILIGIIFIMSLVVSFIFTAVIEDLYTLPSRVKQTAKDGIEGVKDGAQKGIKISTNVVKKSVKSTQEAFGKVGNVAVEGASKIYKNSMTVTSAVAGPIGSWISNKIASRKKKKINKAKINQHDSSSDKETLESLKDINESK